MRIAYQNSIWLKWSANIVSLSRLPLLLLIVLPILPDLLFLQISLLYLNFLLDVVDGYVARRLSITSDLGGFLDIAVDRIIEMGMWLYFVLSVDLPVVFPLVLVSRIWMVDIARFHLALKGQEQKTGVWLTGWRKSLVASPLSKTSYNMLKLGIFTILLIQRYMLPGLVDTIHMQFLLSVLIVFSLLRGMPILLEYILFRENNARMSNSAPVQPHPHTHLFALQLFIDTACIVALVMFN